MSDLVHVERGERTATLTLERPPLNILDIPTIAALDQAIQGLAREPGLQLVVLRGGGKAFSAGVSVADHTPDKVEPMLRAFHGAIRRLYALEAATLAVVHGHCLGGGMELALTCDLVLASDDARFGQPEIQLACYPPVAAALYPKLIGSQRAFEMLLTGRTYDAEEAQAMGLVNWRVPRAELDAKLAALASDLLAKSAAVVRLTKRALRAGERLPFGAALDEAERIYLEDLVRTADMDEGISAFLAKRTAVWRHR